MAGRAPPVRQRRPDADAVAIRVIDYQIDDGRGESTGPIGCSPPCSIPSKHPPPSWPSPTRSAGRSRPRSASSRPTSAAPKPC